MERAGLTLEQTFYQSWPDPIDGADKGEIEYALSKRDWDQRAASLQGAISLSSLNAVDLASGEGRIDILTPHCSPAGLPAPPVLTRPSSTAHRSGGLGTTGFGEHAPSRDPPRVATNEFGDGRFDSSCRICGTFWVSA
jgi:hypothetical protein